ncbi:GNAT family N-acetyltransferase [Azospirillum melinis]|uniref:Acyl-homoserine-lactone synthase n=1 Tax=Azospirillum melinis TaxID=328839 RepID=A0ABX2KPP8_9PROT|nr:acyl-homoserine-lactone synthase [Azospirillum melinis]MBP2310482.1 acyl homoserine lactone synthase [Azospirillum melinis]NUB03758.1 GNAT family N-acetyltransferase [Azospirillum melinis]
MQTVTVTWKSIPRYGELWLQSHQLRHDAFIGRLGYDVPAHDGIEWDQFDTPRAAYIIVEDQGSCAAVCRLVPTTAPYMLRDVFPQLLPYAPPERPDVWEASRIAVDAGRPAAAREAALKALIVGVQQFGLDHGIRHFLGLMPVPIFKRTLMRHGVEVRILQEAARAIDGIPTAAGEIMVSQTTVDRLVPMAAAVAA